MGGTTNNQKTVGLLGQSSVLFAIAIAAVAGSIFFPGVGLVIYVFLQKHLGRFRRATLITLIVIESSQVVAALGTLYGPVIGHVSEAVLVAP